MTDKNNYPKKNKLKEQREQSRLTIYEVAKLLDVQASTVSRHESSSSSLSEEMLTKYAQLYKVRTHELFF